MLINPKWKVRPTIDLIYGTMKFLTCTYHGWWGACMMIHTCRWKNHLPSDKRDQISQVVTQGITVRERK